MKNLIPVLLLCLSLVCFSQATQSLPAKETSSAWIPASYKWDGESAIAYNCKSFRSITLFKKPVKDVMGRAEFIWMVTTEGTEKNEFKFFTEEEGLQAFNEITSKM